MRHYAFNVGDYAAATAHLSDAEDLAYRRLLDSYYAREAPLPADEAACCRLARATSKEARKAVGVVLREFFVLVDEGWRQKRADAEIERQRIKSEQARSAVNVRHDRDRESRRANEQRRADERSTDVVRTYYEDCDPRIPPTTHDTRPPPVPSEPTGGKSVARERAPARAKHPAKTPLPANFAISDRVRAWASEKGHGRLEERLEHFVGKARMNGYRYADWDEALMTAIRDDWAKLNGRPIATHRNDRRDGVAGDIWQEGNRAQPDDRTIDGTAERVA